MSERALIRGHDGYISVEIEAESMTRLPDWLDSRAILRAAMSEYARQRSDNIGPLPLPEHAEAWQEYPGQEVMT